MSYWGYHAMFDISDCRRDLITSESNIRKFVIELVQKIDMVAYGNPMIAHFAQHDPTKSGYSFCQMIETSSITGHLVDESGDAYIDIFSCKTVDTQVAEEVIRKYFRPKKVRLNFITRQAG